MSLKKVKMVGIPKQVGIIKKDQNGRDSREC